MTGLLICGAFLLQAQVKSTEILTNSEGIFPQDDSILLYIYVYLYIYLHSLSGFLFVCFFFSFSFPSFGSSVPVY